ncbi:zinc finger CCCH domain-containing protein 48-like protein [Tanacetum coccineum]
MNAGGASISLTYIASERIIPGAGDTVWNAENLQCLQTSMDNTSFVMSILCWDQFLLSCLLDKTIKLWVDTYIGTLEVTCTHTATLQLPLVPRHSALPFIYASASGYASTSIPFQSYGLNGHAELLLPAAFDFSLGVNDTDAFYTDMTSEDVKQGLFQIQTRWTYMTRKHIRIEDNLLNASSATRTAHSFAQIGHAGLPHGYMFWEHVIKPVSIVVASFLDEERIKIAPRSMLSISK